MKTYRKAVWILVFCKMKALVFCLLIVEAFASPARRPIFSRGYPQIVGGSDAAPGEFPYQLSFQDISYGYAFPFCGASIYNEINVITAAHCVYGEDYDNPKNLMVVAGEHDLLKVSGDEQNKNVVKIAINEGFSYNDMHNDIAILKVETPFEFNDKVASIKLPEKRQVTMGSCTITGWGLLRSGGILSKILQKATVSVVSDEKCREGYGRFKITRSMICAGDGNTDSCQGDSGGPMKCGDYLGGIVSWGRGCADPKYPGVYTEVFYFIDWINENVFLE